MFSKDDPVSGADGCSRCSDKSFRLDNHGVGEMRELFLELKKEGKVMLIASHNSEDIIILCDGLQYGGGKTDGCIAV